MRTTTICRKVAGVLVACVIHFGFAAAVLLVPSTAHASITLPAGVTTYRIALVTQGVRDADSLLIEDYNDFVRSEVAGSSLESTFASVGASPAEWFVYGSTATVDAIDNVLSGGADDLPIFNTRGELVASGWTRVFESKRYLVEPDRV